MQKEFKQNLRLTKLKRELNGLILLDEVFPSPRTKEQLFCLNLRYVEGLIGLPFLVSLLALRGEDSISFLKGLIKKGVVEWFPVFKMIPHNNRLINIFKLEVNDGVHYIAINELNHLFFVLTALLDGNFFTILKVRAFGRLFSFKKFINLICYEKKNRFKVVFVLSTLKRKVVFYLKYMQLRILYRLNKCLHAIN